MGILEGILYMMWRGIAIGIIISAPMGPVGILCIQRTLEKGRQAGFYTGVGAAISDLLYCLLTGFGLSFIEEFLQRNQNIIQLIGSVVLIAFGVYLFRSNPARKLKKPSENQCSIHRNILNGFLFTFSNPLIIFLIIGLFARFNFMLPEITFYHYIVGFLFIFIGALIWWYFVTYFVEKVRAHFNLRSMWLVNKIIGTVILIFAFVGIATGIMGLARAETVATPLRIKGSGEGQKASAAIAGGTDIEIQFRCRNLANNAVLRRHSPWILSLESGGESFGISLETIEKNGAVLHVEAPGCEPTEIASGVNFDRGENAFRLTCGNGRFMLEGGNRTYHRLISGEYPYTAVDSVRFSGDDLELTWLSATGSVRPEMPEITEYGNPDILESRLLRSRDPLEGKYRVFDRSLDEDLLRLGGDYTFALVSEGKYTSKGDSATRYRLIYLSGAVNNGAAWHPGMVKAELEPSGFGGVYDVKWRDAAGDILSNEVKAQIADGLITITFPYQNSDLRLRKLDSINRD